MYKLILLDIDGTLREEYRGIPASAKLAIQKCRKKKCLVVICTGRSMNTIPNDVLHLKVDGYIAGGGSYIQMKQNVIQDQYFPEAKIASVISVLKHENVAYTVESNKMVYMNHHARDILVEMNSKKQENMQSALKQYIQEKIVYEDNIKQYLKQPIHKICLWSSQATFDKIAVVLEDSLYLVQKGIYRDVSYYEIVQRGCDKGSAVHKLQELYGVEPAETLSFGDGQNDIDMFRYAKTKIAMHYAHEELKQMATSICEDIFDDGIYKELKRRKVI